MFGFRKFWSLAAVVGGSRCGREPVRKIRLAKLNIVTNYKNTEKAGVIKVMRRKICDGIWVLRDEEGEKVGFAEKNCACGG